MKRCVYIIFKKCLRIWIEKIYKPRFNRYRGEVDPEGEGWVGKPLGLSGIDNPLPQFIPPSRPRNPHFESPYESFELRARRLPVKWQGIA